MFDKSQMMKGTLEGCILKIIEKETTYGYEILEYLKKNGFADLAEGTIYPLLLRLEKQGYLEAELRESPLGPKRKYYTLTNTGRGYLYSFSECWKQVNRAVTNIFHMEEQQ